MAEITDKKPQYKCVNVSDPDPLSSPPNIPELLGWLNEQLNSDYRRLEELADGVAYALLTDLLFPGTVPLNDVKFTVDSESASVQNLELVQKALAVVGCDRNIPTDELAQARLQESLEFLHWFREFYEVNCGNTTRAPTDGDDSPNNNNKQLVAYVGRNHCSGVNSDDDDPIYEYDKTLIDHAWSRRVLEILANKSRLMESFSWLSTLGGGFSALGERDKRFSARAGALSLGQQLRLAELLGDDRLKVMCHLFAAMASLQLDNRTICLNYIKRVVMPLIRALPYKDPVIHNILKHLAFRITHYKRRVAINFYLANREAPKKSTDELVIR